ncbi:hypothetical protein BASA81_006730 [Batrachochytrium salamandrivorans]|nr:hypothetical protein BASA81_006730 [Batrachochytrium salamandrivorans]
MKHCFQAYIHREPSGLIDVSGLVSNQCYGEWLESQQVEHCRETAMRYYRALVDYVSGMDGKVPFDLEEQAAMIDLLRKHQSWPCFQHCPVQVTTMDTQWYKGFHEKLQSLYVDDVDDDEEEEAKDDDDEMDLDAPAAVTNTELMLLRLPSAQAMLVRNLATGVSKNFIGPLLSSEECETVFQILRFLVFAISNKCKTPQVPLLSTRAVALCNEFDQVNRFVTVVNMTSGKLEERAWAQNDYSRVLFDSSVSLIHSQSELYRTVVAVSAAFHAPGETFVIPQQQVRCRGNIENEFDVTYYVDPTTFLLVAYGSQCL